MGPTNRRKITGEVEARIIAVALRHPNHGPRRLAKLLQRDRISVTASSINGVLHQKDLRSRVKRIEMIKKLAVEKSLPHSNESAIAEESRPAAKLSEPEKPVVVWLKPRKRWQQGLFSPLLWGKWMVHLALVILTVYTGFYMANLQHQVHRDISEIASYLPARDHIDLSAKADHRPPRPTSVTYPDHPVSAKARMNKNEVIEVTPRSTTSQLRSLSLKLIGTLVADPSDKSVAIIEYVETRGQDTFKEGDRAGNLRIKKILRDRIIVETGDKEVIIALMRSLPADDRDRGGQNPMAVAQVTAATPSDAYTAGSDHTMNPMRPTGRSRSLHLDRQVVAVSLADPDQVLQHVAVEPAQSHGHPSGIRIVPIEAGSIFADLGLRSTDVIVGVNGASITTPDQAALLLQSIKAGGNVTIQVKGKRRNRIIQLDIS